MNDTKKGLGILAGVGAALTAIALATKTKAEPMPPDAKPVAGVSITILDSEGNPVPHNSPAELVEGASYTVELAITNRSTKAGQPISATLKTRIYAAVREIVGGAEYVLIPEYFWTDSYIANQSRTYSRNFSVPMGLYGVTGLIEASVFDPNAVRIAAATESLRIRALTIAGSIEPGTIWYPGLAGWQSIVDGQAVPFNTDISIAPGWLNYSEIPIAGHVNLVIVKPDGTLVFPQATLNNDKTANPDDGWAVQFAPFRTDKEGTYTLTAKLFYGVEQLAETTFTIVSVAEIVYAADVVIGA